MFSNRLSGIPKAGRIFLAVVSGLTLAVVIALVLAFLVQFLWNQTIAAMFDLPAISYWQAFGLFVLAKLFFGLGAGRHRSGGKYRRHRHRKHRRTGIESEDGSDLADGEMFRRYWHEEGKEAYESFRANRSEDRKEEPEE